MTFHVFRLSIYRDPRMTDNSGQGHTLEKKNKRKLKKENTRVAETNIMGSSNTDLYFVFMNYDPEYQRLRAQRTKKGGNELDLYVSKKHDEVLSQTLEPGSFKKTMSLVIVDGFAVEITQDQANVLRSAEGVRLVEKNQEIV